MVVTFLALVTLKIINKNEKKKHNSIVITLFLCEEVCTVFFYTQPFGFQCQS